MKQRRITAALLCAILLLSQCNFKIQAASPVTQRQVEAQLAALTEQYEGVAYTDNFNGATQCKGFADMIYDALFHVGTIGIYPAGVYYYMESFNARTKQRWTRRRCSRCWSRRAPGTISRCAAGTAAMAIA